MEQKKTLGIGIVGCGRISEVYFKGIRTFDTLRIVACADLVPSAAEGMAARFGCEAVPVDKLFSHPRVDLVVNLTIPSAHARVSMDALSAGKHVYSEKPLAIDPEQARSILSLAQEKGLLVGAAPDTCLGAGIQTSRELIDSGKLGRILSGTAIMMGKGPEYFHPNPGFFYLKGGGPVLDMAPYYITALVHLLGPVKGVVSIARRFGDSRILHNPGRCGEKIPVEISTHASASLEFQSGAVITLVFSWEVKGHSHKPIELYGTNGSIQVPDPNHFGGPVRILEGGEETADWQEVPVKRPYSSEFRGLGVAEMARAVLTGQPFRTNGDIAYHVLEVMTAIEEASASASYKSISSQPDRPAPMPVSRGEG